MQGSLNKFEPIWSSRFASYNEQLYISDDIIYYINKKLTEMANVLV